MDKKGSRSTPNAPRGTSGADQKKNTDIAPSKQGSRAAPRRRESPCGFSKLNEGGRKPQPQRNTKAYDKRPKPRGEYYTGSEKQSLNHLLNFSFAPRDNVPSSYPTERIGGNVQNNKWMATKKHKYNKEHFVQANCQFIVNERGDYSLYMKNPDALVDWNLIEQVNVQVNDEPACPICLYPPVAGKMTKCGHVYCWPCILHYLSLSDKQWRKCPICYDSIRKEDLKSVMAIPHGTFEVGDTITFKLMKRERSGLTPYPIDTPIMPGTHIFNKSEKNYYNSFCKLVLAKPDDIMEILDREDTALDVLMAEDESCPEICFVEEAKLILNARRSYVLETYTQNKELSQLSKKDTPESDSYLTTNDDNIFSASSGSSLIAPLEALHVSKFYYFYQADDGQHIYLHAINAKMLEHSYGSLEFGPKILSGQILEKEEGSMTEELRRKFRCLQHLPLTCQFEVAEINLAEPTVNEETLDQFEGQIEMRKKRREQRAKEEKKREKKIEAEENRKSGRYFDPPDFHLENLAQFPGVKEAHEMFPEFIDCKPRTESEFAVLTPTARSCSPNLSSSMSLENACAGPSFATMLATPKKPTWPIVKKSTMTSQGLLTPDKPIDDATVNKFKMHSNDSDPDNNDFEPLPMLSFGEAFAEALEKNLDNNENPENNGPMKSNKKKKNRNKHKLLFSTHMNLPPGN